MATEPSLQDIGALIAAGRRTEAEAGCRALLAIDPHNADALWMLGGLYYETGRAGEAVEALVRAVGSAKRAGRALPLEWWLSLGAVQQHMGQSEKALASFLEGAGAFPVSAEARFCVAGALQSLGRSGEAIDNYRAVLALAPGHAHAANNLGVLLLENGNATEAEAAFRSAVQAQPRYPDALVNLGSLLQRTGRVRQAQALLRRAVELMPGNADLQQTLAQNEVYLGQIPAASARLEALVTRHGNRADLISQLAEIRLFQGRRADAVALCQRALAADPSCAAAHFHLATAQHELEDPARLDAINRALAAPGQNEFARAQLFFAAGERLDAMGRYGAAFASYRQGNELRRKLLALRGQAYDREAQDAAIDKVIGAFGESAFASAPAGSDSDLPVFIVGMPRSGTSLVEQILASHPQVAGAGEFLAVGDEVARLARNEGYPAKLPDADSLRRFAEAYCGELSRLGPAKRHVTDKNPANFRHLGFIALAFPNARVIHCRRDRRDVELSCYFQNFAGPGQAFSYDLGDLAHQYDAYERLLAHWRRVLPIKMTEISYETLIADQEAETRRLLSFLGLEWDPSCLEFQKTRRPVATASHTQVRRPIYSRSIGRWRNYARELGLEPGN